jgi:hypothetical protein
LHWHYFNIYLICGSYQAFHYLFHFCGLTIRPTTEVFNPITSDTRYHVME